MISFACGYQHAMARRFALPHAYRAVRYRNFRLYFFGLITSAVGSWMESTAQSWLVFRLTHSAWLLGVVSFAGLFPILALSLFGGVVADRYPRRKLLLITQTLQMGQAFVLAFLTLTNRITVDEVIVLAVILGLTMAFDIPARHSFMVKMVEPEALPSAIVMNSTAFMAARMIGPPLAAVVLALSNEGVCFLINGFSFLAVLWALWLIRVKEKPTADHENSPISSLREGLSYAYHFLPVRALLMLLGLTNFLGVSYVVLMPVFADNILKRGSAGFGMLMGFLGLGSLLGAFFVGARRTVRGLGRHIALSCAVFSVSVILFAFSKIYWLSMVLLVFVGFGLMSQTTSTSTLIQSLVPDRLRGRLMSLYAIMVVGVTPVGSLIAGAFAHRLGAPIVVAAGGACTLFGAFAFALMIPRLRPLVLETLHMPKE